MRTEAKSEIWTALLCGTTLVVAAVLLFARLGHYALWDDEAITALGAEGVLKSGDTTALLGDNVVAYRGGANLRDLHDRLNPPLQFYLAAPSLGWFGETSFAARLPFALCGLLTVAVLLWWCWQARVGWLPLLLFCLGLIGNVSFFLYSRQSRYYGAAILLSVLIVWLYYNWNGRRGTLWLLAVAGFLLYAANYLSYLAVAASLFVDYLMWGRKRRALGWTDAAILIVPQLIGIAALASVWNPLGMDPGHVEPFQHLGERLQLFWWNWRDLNRVEFGALPVLLIAPLLYFIRRDAIWLRAPLALVVFVTVITLLSPQPVKLTFVADVRYLVPIIPLCIFLAARAVALIRPAVAAVAVALVLFGSNFFNGGFLEPEGLRSSIANYARELAHPPGDPYTAVAEWINTHVPPGQSVYVVPNYATYPLMFHAPRAVYAWQLPWPPAPQLEKLPAIHFVGREPPEYLIAFGPNLASLPQVLQALNRPELDYEPAAVLDVYWRDLYRPELFWRSFTPVTNFDRRTDAIYIFKRAATNARAAELPGK